MGKSGTSGNAGKGSGTSTCTRQSTGGGNSSGGGARPGAGGGKGPGDAGGWPSTTAAHRVEAAATASLDSQLKYCVKSDLKSDILAQSPR